MHRMVPLPAGEDRVTNPHPHAPARSRLPSLAARPHGETAVVARMLTERVRRRRRLCRGRARPAAAAGGDPGQPRRAAALARARTASCRSPSSSCSKAAGRGSASRSPPRRSAGPARSPPPRCPSASLSDALRGARRPARRDLPRPSARGWAAALVGYETLLLRELGYWRRRAAQAISPPALERMDRSPARSTTTCLPTGAAMLWPRALA
jgi:DNA repair protein RecO (recombination protein O)